MKSLSLRLICFMFVIVMLGSLSFSIGNTHPSTASLLGVSDAIAADDGFEDEKEPFGEQSEKISDPFERMNRFFFTVNDRLYFWVLKPVGIVYAAYFPKGVRVCVRNAFENVLAPVRIVNTSLQGKFKGAGTEVGRLVINSTLGLGGMFDVASKDFDLSPYDEDLGQTLGYYGVKPGFYLMLPFIGPLNLRDGIGLAGDGFLDPLYWAIPDTFVRYGIKVGRETNNLSLRIGEYEDFKQSALDPYISMRHAYMQHRAEEIEK